MQQISGIHSAHRHRRLASAAVTDSWETVSHPDRQNNLITVCLTQHACCDPTLPYSTPVSRRRFPQGSLGTGRAEDADWPRTPLLQLSAAWKPSPCPSHSCVHRIEPSACRRRNGTYLWNNINVTSYNTFGSIRRPLGEMCFIKGFSELYIQFFLKKKNRTLYREYRCGTSVDIADLTCSSDAATSIIQCLLK